MPNINVELDSETYHEMRSMKNQMSSSSWLAFFQAVFLRKETITEVDILDIKGDSPDTYEVLFQFGDIKYLYRNKTKEFIQVTEKIILTVDNIVIKEV